MSLKLITSKYALRWSLSGHNGVVLENLFADFNKPNTKEVFTY